MLFREPKFAKENGIPRPLEEGHGFYLVRSLGFSTRDFHLTTGTFNLVVKEPIRYHRGGRFQFRAKTHECVSACPRNLYKLLVLLALVNLGYSQVFHIGLLATSSGLFSLRASTQQNSSSGRFKVPEFGTSRHGRCLFKLKIQKEVLATYAQTLRGTLSPNMTPWPGRNCLLQIRCRTRRERFYKTPG